MNRSIQKYIFLSLGTLLIIATSLQAFGQRRPKFVKYCSLFDSSNEEKPVTSSSLMFYSTVGRVDGDDTFLYATDCNGPDYFAIPEGNSKVWARWQTFFDKLPREKNLALEIEFEGKAYVETAHLFGSLDGWARARIKFSSILSIKDVTSTKNVVLPNHDASTPLVDRIEALRNDLRNFLETLFNPSSAGPDVLNSLSDDFVFVDLTARSFKKEQYPGLKAPWDTSAQGLKKTRMSFRLVSNSNDTMIWRGTFELAFTIGSTKTYYCDITLGIRDGNWTLLRAAMVH